jgi:hypothetical protein
MVNVGEENQINAGVKDSRPFWRKKRWWVVGGAVLALYVLVKSLLATMTSIFPPLGASPSTSMEMTEYVFRVDTEYKDRKTREKITKKGVWKIELPRAFVNLETGSNSSIRDSSGRGGRDISVHAQLDTSTFRFLPWILRKDDSDHKLKIAYSFSSRSASTTRLGNNFCESVQLLYANYQNSPPKERKRITYKCLEEDRDICRIYSSYKGWQYSAGVPREAFHPDNANFKVNCEAVHGFLGTHTTFVDNLN